MRTADDPATSTRVVADSAERWWQTVGQRACWARSVDSCQGIPPKGIADVGDEAGKNRVNPPRTGRDGKAVAAMLSGIRQGRPERTAQTTHNTQGLPRLFAAIFVGREARP